MLEERLAAACEAVQALADAESASMAACLQAKLSATALQELQATLGKLQAAMANAGTTSACTSQSALPVGVYLHSCISYMFPLRWAGWDGQATTGTLLAEIDAQQEHLVEANSSAEAAQRASRELQASVAAAETQLVRWRLLQLPILI